jgi:mono/diheme cytochrome c family protein
MTRWLVMVAVVLLLILTLGCGSRRAGYGFHLPAGDPEAGKVAFAQLECVSCHRVDGADFPATKVSTVPPVVLGGPVAVLPTAGELTTDIINPSVEFAVGYRPTAVAVAGHSRMPDYSHRMTVRQMADLVTFLQSRYQYAPVPAPLK